MKPGKSIRMMTLAALLAGGLHASLHAGTNNEATLNFMNLKFGMFIHFNMATFTGEQWASPDHDPREFAPADLDCNQWARAAKSAGMKYAVLTAKHHDGFCLWDSKVTDYDVASGSNPKDIVKPYTEAFRKAGLKTGLYYSIWDRHHGIEHGKITPEKIAFMKAQLTELLSNYGEVLCIVTDGWGSKWGEGPDFEELPYHVLADHIHSIQPDCLVINHSCRPDLDLTQIVHYEATHGQHCPFDNTLPSQQGPVMQPQWFWHKGVDRLPVKPLDEIVSELHFANSHCCNYLLNAAPNNEGLMDQNVLDRLKEVGEAITLSPPLNVLPEIRPVHDGLKVAASSSSGEGYEAENVLDCNLFTYWQPAEGDKEPWVELDFGKPQTFNALVCADYKQLVRAFKVEALVDGKWKRLTDGDRMTFHFKGTFPEVTARKYRLTILEKKAPPLVEEMTLIKY